VAEFAHAAFGQNGIRLRLIVRRVHPPPADCWRSSPNPAIAPGHGPPGHQIGAGGGPSPPGRGGGGHPRSQGRGGSGPPALGRFAAKAAWLAFPTMAHNPARRVLGLGLPRNCPLSPPPGECVSACSPSPAAHPPRPPQHPASAPGPAPAGDVPQCPTPDPPCHLTARPRSPHGALQPASACQESHCPARFEAAPGRSSHRASSWPCVEGLPSQPAAGNGSSLPSVPSSTSGRGIQARKAPGSQCPPTEPAAGTCVRRWRPSRRAVCRFAATAESKCVTTA
jgi:hypothetical protein